MSLIYVRFVHITSPELIAENLSVLNVSHFEPAVYTVYMLVDISKSLTYAVINVNEGLLYMSSLVLRFKIASWGCENEFNGKNLLREISFGLQHWELEGIIPRCNVADPIYSDYSYSVLMWIDCLNH